MTDRQLTYNGDRTGDIVGQVVGPTELGQVLTIYAADYDAELDVTVAHLRPSTEPEVAAAIARITPPPAMRR